MEGEEEKKKKEMIQPGSAGSSLVACIIDLTTSTSGEVEASNLINVGAAGDLLNSPVMGLCGSMMTEEESPGTELSTNVTTVVSVLKRDHLLSNSVDIPAPPGEDGVTAAVPHQNPPARARERKKARLLQDTSNNSLPPKPIYKAWSVEEEEELKAVSRNCVCGECVYLPLLCHPR